ncbi:MAG TPA: hypothetical protein VHE35_15335 [Kofleriaceae bacterium]|nr:hypothetical protein [Kofleriaceae bacterium]
MLTTGYRRSADRAVHRLEAPLTTDPLGTGIVYHATIDGAVHVSGSVRALARRLGAVTLEPLALAEALAFGLVLRDRTIVTEVRSIPAGTTLHPDGRLEAGSPPRSTAAITDPAEAATRVRAVLDEIIAAEESRYELHCAGLTGGRDSRILAALPKATPDRWHWLSVTGDGDAEHRGSLAAAKRLELPHHAWLEWKADYLDGLVAESADLAGGIGACSDASLLSGNFARYRRDVLGRSADDAGVVLWLGTLGDELLAGTWLPPHVQAATTIWDALAPRAGRLGRILAPRVVERFADDGAFYRSNPFAFEAACDEDTGWFLRQLTRGRAYLCRMVQSFDRVCPTQLNPYMHPSMIEVVLALHPALRQTDAVRRCVLEALGPDLDAPSAYGFKAPAYASHVLAAVTAEAARCPLLDGLLEPGLLDGLRRGELRDLAAPGDGAPSAYRVHTDASPLIRSLRDYEHLLMYATFLDLLVDDGVTVTGVDGGAAAGGAAADGQVAGGAAGGGPA